MLGIQNTDRRQKYITLQVVAYMIQNAWTKKMVHDMHSRYGFNIFYLSHAQFIAMIYLKIQYFIV